MDRPIDVYLQWAEDAIQFAQDRKTPFTLAQLLQTAYHAVNKTGIYSLTLKEWSKKAMADKTCARFKTIFAEEYDDLVEEIKITTRDAGFRLANAMQEIKREIDQPTIAAREDKYIVTKLTEAVEKITKSSA